MRWLVFLLLGTPATAENVDLLPAIEATEACVAAKASAEDCVGFVYAMCEGTKYFGEAEGAGRGWCEGLVRETWELVVTRAEKARLCPVQDESLWLAIFVASEGAKRAWRGFRDAECEMAAMKDYRGVGSGESAKTACIAHLSAQRVGALLKEKEACE